MSKPAEVSESFMSFYQGAASDTVEKSKAAESNLGNIPLAIGAAGQCRIEKFRFGSTPDKVENGVLTKKGTPFCEVTVRSIAPEDITGRLLKRTFWFSDKNGNLAQALETYFSTLVTWGLPEEVRKNHKNPTELADWFMTADITLEFVVTANPSDTLNDGKGLRLYRKADQLPANDSIVPSISNVAPPAAKGGKFKAGDKVTFKGEAYEFVEQYPNGKIGLKNLSTGAEALANESDLS
jgi:hypothetical protein